MAANLYLIPGLATKGMRLCAVLVFRCFHDLLAAYDNAAGSGPVLSSPMSGAENQGLVSGSCTAAEIVIVRCSPRDAEFRCYYAFEHHKP